MEVQKVIFVGVVVLIVASRLIYRGHCRNGLVAFHRTASDALLTEFLTLKENVLCPSVDLPGDPATLGPVDCGPEDFLPSHPPG